MWLRPMLHQRLLSRAEGLSNQLALTSSIITASLFFSQITYYWRKTLASPVPRVSLLNTPRRRETVRTRLTHALKCSTNLPVVEIENNAQKAKYLGPNSGQYRGALNSTRRIFKNILCRLGWNTAGAGSYPIVLIEHAAEVVWRRLGTSQQL